MKRSWKFFCLSLAVAFMLLSFHNSSYAMEIEKDENKGDFSFSDTQTDFDLYFSDYDNLNHYFDYLKSINTSFDDLVIKALNEEIISEDPLLVNQYLNTHKSKYQSYFMNKSNNDIHQKIDPSSTVTPPPTKPAVRAAIRLAAESKKSSWPFSHELLMHSLQDRPSAKHVRRSNSTLHRNIVNTISDSTAYKNASINTVVTFSSPADLANSIHRATKRRSVSMSGSTQTVRIYLYDRYDFDFNGWGVDMNNLAALAQRLGAIVPYDVYIYITETTYNCNPGCPYSLIDSEIHH